MYYLEHQGLVGSVFSKQKNREFKLNTVSFSGTFFPGNENAGGSAICIHRDLLPEEAIVTHLITCQGREHIVNIQSGRQSLLIVNVHFERELTLRQSRERLRLINPHWPSYPDAVGIILGDFNICEPKEGRFQVTTRQYVLSFISRLLGSNRANTFQAGCPNILSSVLF